VVIWQVIDADLVKVYTEGGKYLIWPRDQSGTGCNNGVTSEWTHAKSWAESLVWKGYDDWRLPTKDELKELYDYGRTHISYASGGYWSSTSYYGPSTAWMFVYYVDFSNGFVTGYDKEDSLYVRAVRSGP